MKAVLKYVTLVLIMLYLQGAESGSKFEEANKLFAQGEYKAALSRYQHSNLVDMKFCQYRIALIYYFGLHGKKDLIRAYAWSGVAQENKILILLKMHTLIARELPAEDRQAGNALMLEIDKEHGAAIIEREKANDRVQCTGSRVGSACDRVLTTFAIDGSAGYLDSFTNYIVANRMTPDDADEFNKAYSQLIEEEFARFDD